VATFEEFAVAIASVSLPVLAPQPSKDDSWLPPASNFPALYLCFPDLIRLRMMRIRSVGVSASWWLPLLPSVAEESAVLVSRPNDGDA